MFVSFLREVEGKEVFIKKLLVELNDKIWVSFADDNGG